MSYQSIKDLPKGVQGNLPEHAQEIYRAAFNNAWEQYKDPAKRRGNDDRETVAHKVAWDAVKQKYHKDENGNWHKDGTD